MEAIIDTQDQTIKDQKETIESLKKNAGKREEPQTTEDESDVESKNETIKKLQRKVEELRKEKNELIRLKAEKECDSSTSSSSSDSSDTEEEPPEEKTLTTIIMDSNREAIRKHLKSNDIFKSQYTTDCYTVAHLEEATENIIKNHKKGQQYIIGLGTNNMRKRHDPEEVANAIKKCTIKIRSETKAMVHILEIPPQSDIRNEKPIREANDILSKMPAKDAGVVFIKTPKLHDEVKEDILKQEEMGEIDSTSMRKEERL